MPLLKTFEKLNLDNNGVIINPKNTWRYMSKIRSRGLMCPGLGTSAFWRMCVIFIGVKLNFNRLSAPPYFLY